MKEWVTVLRAADAAARWHVHQGRKGSSLGQRVAWHDSADDQGTVRASDWSGVRIEWDNGKNQFFHHDNMGEVEVARPNLA